MKLNILFLAVFCFGLSFGTFSQYDTNHDFMEKRQAIGKSGMIVYTSWSGANLAAGAALWGAGKGEWKYFGQMNVLWSAINLGISIPGLLGSFRDIPAQVSNGDMIQQQYGSETTYLINGGLDFLYIGTGAFLKGIADKHPSNVDRLNGFGNSILIQGGFLLIFDFVQYFRHRSARKNANNLFFSNLSLSETGIGFKYCFN